MKIQEMCICNPLEQWRPSINAAAQPHAWLVKSGNRLRFQTDEAVITGAKATVRRRLRGTIMNKTGAK
jgi:hypothetical protein